MNGKRVLIVDDDKAIQNMVKAVLEQAGYEVFAALDAMQGPMFARKVKPDLIVLDINLPGGSGEKVFERLRAMTNTAAVPILIYTAVPIAELLPKVREAANAILLAKPASPEDIAAAVANLLAKK